MPKITRIHHIAILADDLSGPLSFWRDALGMEVTQVKDLPAEAAQIAFLPAADSEIELVRPTTSDSGLAKYLEKRGPGMHHVCLEVDDIEAMLAQLKAKGIQLINETPRVNAEGKKYAFVHPKSAFGVMVELYELPPDGSSWK